jgi:hypothetical protein
MLGASQPFLATPFVSVQEGADRQSAVHESNSVKPNGSVRLAKGVRPSDNFVMLAVMVRLAMYGPFRKGQPRTPVSELPTGRTEVLSIKGSGGLRRANGIPEIHSNSQFKQDEDREAT